MLRFKRISGRTRIVALVLPAIAAALTAALVVVVAIGPGQGSEGNSSQEKLRDKLTNDLAPVQAGLPFHIIVPSYLPLGTIPVAHGEVTSGAIEILFQVAPDRTAPQPEQMFIDLHERQSSGSPIDPAVFMIIDGRHVGVFRDSGPGLQADMTLYATLKGVDVNAAFIWRPNPWLGQDTITLTHAMEEQAVKVFQSMMED